MSLRRLEVVDIHSQRHHLHIDVSDATEVQVLETEMNRLGFRATSATIGDTTFSASQLVGDLGLVDGATIGIGRIEPQTTPLRAGVYVTVVAGPDSGLIVPIGVDTPMYLGRSSDCDLVLDDPLLSGRHAEILMDVDGQITVRDLGSTNGTLVEEEPLGADPVEIGHDTLVHVGSTVLAVHRLEADGLAVVPSATEGSRMFPRRFRSALSPLPRQVTAPRPPADLSSKQGRMWWRALLPIVSGFGMAAITGRWIFLLIIALSPIVGAVEAFRRNRARKSGAIADEEKYRRDLVEFRAAATAARRVELTRKRNAAHCGGRSTLLTRSHHRRLWERLPDDEDFLSVAVGLATLPSDITADDPEGALDADQWGTPLSHHFLLTGAMAVVGPRARSRAVARNLVINLAATHGPADLDIVVLTDDEDGADWGFARWLPHVFTTNGCNIGTNEPDRRRMIRQLQATLERRRESDPNALFLPAIVVILDGVDLMPSSELRELLTEGAALGITGVTVDAERSPEGVGATLRLGANADEAEFESRAQPFVDSVIVSQMTEATAERAARPLASLRQTSAADAVGLGGTVHLVDLDPVARLSGSELVERWAASSPTSNVMIGATSDGVMSVDIVKDGPHGLIGGTSGSGKTEFLKTLFVSLCLHNHPDDLSIVVVDFKGGVDHDAIRPLPHVIDVATNLDIDQFKRTIAMLKAEQMRRQDLLSSSGASNVVAYRAARQSDPSLPPMPRLLVVVDEFGELLSNADGKEQLKELESITRIGRALGLHLLLVTQSFEGALPPQIDANAGLRISLRVQKPGHSKIVLDSDAAALIPDNRIGRAFGRFHGRDLIEFQTARVAGRRRDIAEVEGEVDIRLVPFPVLGGPTFENAIDDVPAEDTDMWAMIERINEAAALSGWRQSAVPWPAPLPEVVSTTALLRAHTGPGVPIGLADFPDQQRRGTTTITERDEQFLVLGLPTAPVPEVMVSYAAALAASSSPDDVHIYGIDLLGRGFQALESLPHCGTIASRNDALALRMLRWISSLAAERRAELSKSGASNTWEHGDITGELPPLVVLMISGAERIANADGPQFALSGPLQAAMADAIGVRIQIVLGGLPRIATHRIGMNVERKIVMQLADRTEYSGVGAPRHFATELRTERRAIDVPDGRVTQLGRLAAPGEIEGDVVRKLAERLEPATVRPPFRFADVSWPLPLTPSLRLTQDAPAGDQHPVPIGLELSTGTWSWLDAIEDGPTFIVTGPPKSGRSTTVLAIAELFPEGWTPLTLALSGRSPLATATNTSLGRRCTPDDIAEAAEGIDGPLLLLIDDFHRIQDTAVLKTVFAREAPVFTVLAAPMEVVSTRTGLMRDIPASRAGVLVAPTSVLDGSSIGMRRLPDDVVAGAKPGRGILQIAGEARQIQIPLPDIALSSAVAEDSDARRRRVSRCEPRVRQG